MRLKKLILHGFKSFADRTELTFDGGIIGVVGPNGCGKSNVSDAVRWVLGEQSAKMLRGAKMEDVIFNGTEKRRRLAFCEVSLIFENEDRTLPIDYAEVEVTRRVYRSGEGEYKINGTQCRLRDIVDLFRDTGVGREGYSLIGQGRIDEILSAKSEDRRQVFEEAAGIVKFKTRKLEAQRRMERTRDNLDRVEDILDDLEKRLGPLKEQSETAREYLALRDELKGLDLNIFLLRTERYEQRIKELQDSISDLNEEINRALGEIEESSRVRSDLQNELERYEADAAEKREAVQNLIREVETAEGRVQVLNERIHAEEKNLDRLNSDCVTAQAQLEETRGHIVRLDALIVGEQSAVAKEQTDCAALDEKLTAAEAEIERMEAEAEEGKQQIIHDMNRLGDVRSRRARLSATLTALEERLREHEREQTTQLQSAEEIANVVERAKQQLSQENSRKTELDAQALQTDREVRSRSEASIAVGNKIAEAKSAHQQNTSRLKLLREMQKDYEGYNNSVKQVLLQARRVHSEGIHGVVADLISVPEKLERAIDMVLGGALQNIVVSRDEDAKQMIEYLRNNRMGRATFLPISSVRGRTLSAQERQVLKMPGCVGLASELIDFDPRYQGVMDNLLGRTVVAEDLDSGIAIQRAGRYQFRLVTLKGDVMHSGGSMTGGSIQSRMTSLLSRTREIEQTAKTVTELEAKLATLQKQQDECEALRRTLKNERNELFEELRKQEIICARAETQLNAAIEEQNAHNARIERSAAEAERLRAQHEDIEAQLAETNDTQDSEQQSNEERQKAVRKLQEDLYTLKSETDILRKQTTDARVALATRTRGLEARVAERKRYADEKLKAESTLTESTEAALRCQETLQHCREESNEAAHQLEEKHAELKTVRTAFDASEAARTNVQRTLQTRTEEADALRRRHEESVERQHKSELLLTRVEGEFKQIRDRIWEDYELTYAGAEEYRVEDFKLTESEKRGNEIRKRIRAMGTVNVAAVDDYRATSERVDELHRQRDDLTKAQNDLQNIIEELENDMESRFKIEFAKINENFQQTFVRLFGGGKAMLNLTDPKDALNCGIEIVAQPPGKKLQMLSLLSGGERALTAIAILFAILDLKPTPFCILDEIEAALDDANIDTYADYLRSYSENTQFIVITHRKGTMERCNALYGVVMEEKGISKTVSVKLDDAIAQA